MRLWKDFDRHLLSWLNVCKRDAFSSADGHVGQVCIVLDSLNSDWSVFNCFGYKEWKLVTLINAWDMMVTCI